MKLNKTILATAAVVLPLTLGIGSAMAYFTANDNASGGFAIEAGMPNTDITETFSDMTKHVTITNNNDSIPVYVRVLALSGNMAADALKYSGEGWSTTPDDEGYYYYIGNGGVLEAGKSTPEFNIKIEIPSKIETDMAEFNVVVVYERMPVQYNEDGTALLAPDKADWTDYKVTVDPGYNTNSGSGAGSTVETDTEGGN